MGRRSVLAGLLLAVLVVGLSGCRRFTDTIAPGDEVETFALYGTRTISQRFIAHHAGLVEIGVLLQAQPGSGAVTLHLREDAEGASDMATVTIVPPASEAPTYHTFALPVQDDVNGKSFLLLLEAPQATGETAALLPYSTGASGELDLWLDGDLSSGGHVSIQLHYDPAFIVKDLARQVSTFGLRSLWLLFLSALFYLLPGGALVVWLLREGDWIERTVVALGMSVAVYALLVYATMTGLRLGRAATYGFLALCAGLIGLRWWLDGRPLPSLRGAWGGLKADPAPAALAFVFALALGVRIFVVRDLVAPMWGDGYHHTMISQLLVDNGGLFDSWEPYAPLTTFTYHFGFHANVALYHWMSGEPVIQSVIWIGQMMNALAALALYPLAIKVSGGNRWAGVVAVLVAGLLSPMPMYYVNWGRYTQLAGQVILPVLMWLTWELVEARRWHWRLVGLATVACVGLGVTHYRVVLMYGAFVVAWGLVWLVRFRRERRETSLGVLRLAVVAGLTVILYLPWGWHVFDARIPAIGQYLVEAKSEFHRTEYNAIGSVFFYVPRGLLVLGTVGLAWQTWRGRFGGWLMVLWAGGMLLLSNPHVLSLPGIGIVNNFTVFLAFYIPVAVLTGVMVGEARAEIQRWGPWVSRLLLGVVVVLAAGWGVVQRVKDLNTQNALITRADMRAFAWIREHVPPEASFLVNSFAAYGNTAVVGADAGWWIPLLAGRRSTLPPLTYASELQDDPHYPERLLSDLAYLQRVSPASVEGAEFLRDRGVTHVYVGRAAGMVGNPGEPLLDGEALLSFAEYRLEYGQDGVWILALVDALGQS